ncbi:hypothetical protein DINM_001634 [Dirofilaria immitis]|nr:hypothetical protein [Dirofilaria immitis]
MSDRAVVLARRAMIRARTEISEDGMTPKEKIDQVLISFKENGKYANLSVEEIEQMEDMILGRIQRQMWSESNSIRSLYINRRKLIVANHNDKQRKVEHLVSLEENKEGSVSNLSGEIPVQNVSLYSTAQINAQPNLICEPEGDYGPVLYEALSCQRRKSIILFESRRFPNKISEWALKMPTNDITMYYTCVLCRKLKDKGKRQEPPIQYPPPARIVVRNGRFMVHPDYPKTPHIFQKTFNCTTNQDANYRCITIDPSEGSTSGIYVVEEPGTWPQNPEVSLSDDSDSDYEVLLTLDADQNVNVSAAVAAGSDILPNASNADFTEKHEKLSSMYSCSIVGCSFQASTLTDLDIHLGEHELLDEEQIIQYEIFRQAENPYENSEAVEIIDEVSLSEPFRKRPKIDSKDDLASIADDNEVGCKEDSFEKSDLPTDVPSDEGIQRNPADLRSSIQRRLQSFSQRDATLEVDGYLKRLQQRLCDIQSSSMRYFHNAAELLQSAVSSHNDPSSPMRIKGPKHQSHYKGCALARWSDIYRTLF